jgi:Kef-type K+ transport system membrane component KefB
MDWIASFLGLLVVVLGTAKLLGALARLLGQPAVLGELLAGVLLGGSVLGLIDLNNAADPRGPVLHVFAEIGVALLLFTIGLETDLGKLLRVGGASTMVAVVGVALPFAMGYAVCRLMGLGNEESIVAGAALTATSVGITARVLSDLGRLHDPEGQVILGAAVLDDILGLVILTVVAAQTQGQAITFGGVVRTTAIAFGFLLVTLVLGKLVVPLLVRISRRVARSDTVVLLAVMLAFALAWLAHECGSAVIIGAFAAGLLLAGTAVAPDIERGVKHLAHFFVPIFFVMVGAAVDVTVFNPLNAGNWQTLQVGGLLILVAVVGKFLAGYAPFWFHGRKSLIGVGMIPRGEVGLIFAQMGLSSHIFPVWLFSAVTLMVMVTTFLAPPLLKLVAPRRRVDSSPAGAVAGAKGESLGAARPEVE